MESIDKFDATSVTGFGLTKVNYFRTNWNSMETESFDDIMSNIPLFETVYSWKIRRVRNDAAGDQKC